MNQPLIVHLKASQQLCIAYLLLAVVVAVGICALSILIWLKAALVFMLTVLIIRVIYQYAMKKAANSIVALLYQPQLAQTLVWQIESNDGTRQPVRLRLQDCYVTTYLTVLNVMPVGPRQRWYHRSMVIVILPDSLAVDDYRRLRVLLKWRNHQTLDQV